MIDKCCNWDKYVVISRGMLVRTVYWTFLEKSSNYSLTILVRSTHLVLVEASVSGEQFVPHVTEWRPFGHNVQVKRVEAVFIYPLLQKKHMRK